MIPTLHTLLARMAQGTASPDEVARVRERVAEHPGIDADIRQGLFQDEAEFAEDAALLLELLEPPAAGSTALGQAVREEAGVFEAAGNTPLAVAIHHEVESVDLVDRVMGRLGLGGRLVHGELADAVRWEGSSFPGHSAWEGEDDLPVAQAVLREAGAFEVEEDPELPVASAVRAEAGSVDLAKAVLEELALAEVVPLGPWLRGALGGQAVEVWPEVARVVSESELPVAEAVRHEAGRLGEVGATALAPVVELPPAANRRHRGWWLSLAAAAALFVGGANLLQRSVQPVSAPEAPLVFATGSDTVIGDLQFSNNAIGMIEEGADGAIVLWVDEEGGAS